MPNVLENSIRHNRPLTAGEYARLPDRDDGYKDELVQGSVVCEPPPSYDHGATALRIARLLADFVERYGLGEVVGEAGFLLARQPDTVRGPDAAFVSTERLARHRGQTFFTGAPDLAVEVISPSSSKGSVSEKTRDYLAAGARMVWNVDPERATVTVHVPDRRPVVLRGEDRLEGGDVLPGFSIPVRRLFG